MSQLVEQLDGDLVIYVLPPVLPVGGHRDLPVGPLTGQVYADAGNDCGAVQEAEGGQVEAESPL